MSLLAKSSWNRFWSSADSYTSYVCRILFPFVFWLISASSRLSKPHGPHQNTYPKVSATGSRWVWRRAQLTTTCLSCSKEILGPFHCLFWFVYVSIAVFGVEYVIYNILFQTVSYWCALLLMCLVLLHCDFLFGRWWSVKWFVLNSFVSWMTQL